MTWENVAALAIMVAIVAIPVWMILGLIWLRVTNVEKGTPESLFRRLTRILVGMTIMGRLLPPPR